MSRASRFFLFGELAGVQAMDEAGREVSNEQRHVLKSVTDVVGLALSASFAVALVSFSSLATAGSGDAIDAKERADLISIAHQYDDGSSRASSKTEVVFDERSNPFSRYVHGSGHCTISMASLADASARLQGAMSFPADGVHIIALRDLSAMRKATMRHENAHCHALRLAEDENSPVAKAHAQVASTVQAMGGDPADEKRVMSLFYERQADAQALISAALDTFGKAKTDEDFLVAREQFDREADALIAIRVAEQMLRAQSHGYADQPRKFDDHHTLPVIAQMYDVLVEAGQSRYSWWKFEKEHVRSHFAHCGAQLSSTQAVEAVLDEMPDIAQQHFRSERVAQSMR